MNTDAYSILIVDDQEDNRDMLSRRLARAGYHVVTAPGGHEALDRLARESFQLVLLDIMMPEMDGYQTLEAMKKSADLRAIPVIMLTSVSGRESVVRCLKLGAVDFVVKPFDIHALRSRIEKTLTSGADSKESRESAKQTGAIDELQLNRQLERVLSANNVDFPVLPAVSFKIVEIVRKKDVHMSEIAEVIQREPAATAKLVAISNSAHYRGAVSFVTVEDAVLRIGLKDTLNYVLALSSKGMINTEDQVLEQLLVDFWRHSLATAVCSKVIARHLQAADPEFLFIIGLLHDIGKLLVLKVLTQMSGKGASYDSGMIARYMVDRHAEIGIKFLKKSNFDQEFVQVAQHHHAATTTLTRYSTNVQIVAFANLLAHRLTDEETIDVADLADSPHAKLLKLELDMLANASSEALEEIKELQGLI